MLIILEGLVNASWLLLVCVICTAYGPAGMAVFYEKNVQERVISLGFTTTEKLKTAGTLSVIAIFVPQLTVFPLLVFLFNGTTGFLDSFLQLTCVYLIAGLFDRLFIDEWWVSHTKAWIIPGTEDLMPYIPKEAKIKKWAGTLIGFPLLAAIIAGIAQLFR
jgi:hypothetical protein